MIQKIIFVFLIAVIIVSWYFGAYLPLKKSQLLIIAIQNAGSARSVEEFENAFLPALNFYSPIGHNETVKQMANTVYGVLNQTDASPEAAAEIIRFTEEYMVPLLSSRSGDGLVQNFYILGDIYRTAAFKYQNINYLNKAAELYNEGLVLAPKRPQFLYGLLQIYIQQQDNAKATEITRKLLEYWPDDPALKGFLGGQPTSISF